MRVLLFCTLVAGLTLATGAQAAGPVRATPAARRMTATVTSPKSGFTPEQQKYFLQAAVYDKVAVSFFNRSSDGIDDWLDKSIGSFFQGLSYLALTAAGTALTYDDSAAYSFQYAAYCYQQHLLYD